MCKCTSSLSPSDYGYFTLPQYHIYILCSWYRGGYSCHFHADGHHLLTANTADHLPVSDQRKVSQVHFSSTCLWPFVIWYQYWIEEQCGISSGDHLRTCHLWECASMNEIDIIVVYDNWVFIYPLYYYTCITILLKKFKNISKRNLPNVGMGGPWMDGWMHWLTM